MRALWDALDNLPELTPLQQQVSELNSHVVQRSYPIATTEDGTDLWDRGGPEAWEAWDAVGSPVSPQGGRVHRAYLNVTPHPVRLQDEAETFTVPPSGFVVSATPCETAASDGPSGVELVRTGWEANAETSELLDAFSTQYPDVIIMGSIIAAQAYPGQVLALVPAPGFERVPPAEKVMRGDKFTTF